MERVGGRQVIMEELCSTGQSPQWVVVPMEEEGELRFIISKQARYTIPSDAIHFLIPLILVTGT